MKLFEALLIKENDFVSHNLVLRNLLGRNYLGQSNSSLNQANQAVPNEDSSPRDKDSELTNEIPGNESLQNDDSRQKLDGRDVEQEEAAGSHSQAPESSPAENVSERPELSPQSSIGQEFCGEFKFNQESYHASGVVFPNVYFHSNVHLTFQNLS